MADFASGATKWLTQGFLRRFVGYALICVLMERLGDVAFYHFFGWASRPWSRDLFIGLFMALLIAWRTRPSSLQ
jgi:hypothetical protein